MRPDPAARQPLNGRPRSVQPRRLLAAAAGIAVMLVAGCSGGSVSGTAVSGTITIAASRGVDDVPLYIADQNRLFATAGLHVVIRDFGSAALNLQAVEDGHANIAATDYGNIFTKAAAIGNLRILADGYDTGAGSAEILISPQAQGITSPNDLRGQPIGLPSDSLVPAVAGGSGASSGGQQVNSLLAAAATKVISNYLGVSAAQTLVWQPMTQQQEVSALQSGQLKAALLTEPYVYQAESRFGATPLVDAFSSETANLPQSGYVATQAWVAGNPAAVADFQSAMAAAQSQASMVTPVQTALKTFPGIDSAAAKMVSIGTYPTVTSSSALYRVELLLWTAGMLPPKLVDLPSVPKMLVRG